LDFVAKTFQGLEPVLADELASLGASDIRPLKRAVAFSGDQELLYRANYELRTAISVLVSIHSFTCRNERQYYQSIYDFDWQQWLGLHDTFAIKAVVNSPHFNHSKFMALKAKDAIVDRFRDRTGRRPSINPRHPDVLIQIHIGGDQCTVSLDSSGEPLFKRNYRVKTGQAPLNEVLAAGMLKLAGWPQQAAFVDPMCGSGTLPIEAALIARNMPAQQLRPSFGFQRWPDFKEDLWEKVKAEAEDKIIPLPKPVFGFDQDRGIVQMAQQNAGMAGVASDIHFAKKKFEDLDPPAEKGLIVTNPPYDERLHRTDIMELYANMGTRFKHNFPGYEAWVISSNFSALQKIGLRPSQKIPLFNGPLECKFQKYELYEGSKKEKETREE
jgi:putative N6-adenine-specific DNA methylase